MTTLRQMTNEDLLAYKRLSSVCYTYRDESPAEELPEELLRMRMGVFDENGALLSAMMQIPYQVRFAGETVRLIGIGGVVTDPAARGQRGVRRLFEEGLPRFYREGSVFSALYPFSHRFYRKFGYEWAEFWRSAEFDRCALRPDLLQADEIVRVLPGEDDQGMRQIYETYVSDKNLPVLRDDWMWSDLRKGTPWDSLKHTYVLKAEGRPVAYWIGRMEKQNSGARLTMLDMAWTCRRGMEAIFAMIRGMNEVDGIAVKVQSGFEPRNLVSEPYDVADKETCTGMVRVINAARALALLPAPILPGRLVVRVRDDQIEGNCGCFVVSGDGYSLTVEKNDREQADISCRIEGLSALVIGRERFDDAVNAGLAQILSDRNMKFASMLFAQRKLHMNQGF